MTEIVGRLPDGAHVRVQIATGCITAIDPLPGTGGDTWIAPGFVDLQVNGFGGHDINAPDVTPATVRALAETQWAAGITAFCPTVITAPEPAMINALRVIAAAIADDPLLARMIPCIHVEGPFVAADDGPRGAHDRRYLRPPDIAEFERWQEAARGRVGIVTLAPELPAAVAFIRHITAAGVVAAIGHTAAAPGEIDRAVDAGAALSTHLGNGVHPTLPRHPNCIWTQLADDRLTASIVADGHHLPQSVLTTVLRTKGIDRTILVSDTVAVAGLPPGRYETPVGGTVEITADGQVVLPGTPLLAGASRPLTRGLTEVLRIPGLQLADAIRLCTANPARLIGLPGRDEVRVGAPADLTVFRYADGAVTDARAIVPVPSKDSEG